VRRPRTTAMAHGDHRPLLCRQGLPWSARDQPSVVASIGAPDIGGAPSRPGRQQITAAASRNPLGTQTVIASRDQRRHAESGAHSPPRLLLAADLFPDAGGIQAIIENFAAELDGEYEIHLAFARREPGRQSGVSLPRERVHHLGVPKAVRPFVMPTSLVFTSQVAHALRKLVKRIRPAALVTQDALYMPVPGALATRGTPTKLAVMDHGTLTNVRDTEWRRIQRSRMRGLRRAVWSMGFALDSPWRALRWRWGIDAADAAWYVGSELEPLFARAGERAARYTQIVPPDFAPPSPSERVRARRRFGVERERNVINVVSRLDGEKGFDTILLAIAAVHRRHTDFTLLIAGDGSLEGWVASEIKHLGLERNVRLIGRLDRASVQQLHHASDFHLYAGTISCGLSICLLEAMACGVIPIASDMPFAQRELVGDAGWVFPAGETSALTKALSEALASSDARRQRLREAVAERLAESSEPGLAGLIQELIAA
jgi:glycosyltransferase involved in cell wall biosynthesis